MENFHYHNSFEIYYLVSGNRKMLVEDKIYELFTSDNVLINPNILHRNMVSGAPYQYCLCSLKRITILINNILKRKHMNNIFLKSNNLTVEISTLGAEIQSLKKG